jgi:N-acetylgalactosamine kinase
MLPQVLVHGVVPTGSGLSSSAAIVCASSLAILAAHGISLTKAEVAEFACLAERYVGVSSGGMDQAISMMGMPGVAKLVEFNPVGGLWWAAGCGLAAAVQLCMCLQD